MSNAILYTFSTLAQTLSGAIALIGAFVLYRLQSINADLEFNASRFMGPFHFPCVPELEATAMEDHYRRGHYEKMLQIAQNVTLPPQVYQPVLETARMQDALAMRRTILRVMRQALVLTAGMIVSSIAVLAFSESIAASRPAVGTSVLFVGVMGAVACIDRYATLIWKSF